MKILLFIRPDYRHSDGEIVSLVGRIRALGHTPSIWSGFADRNPELTSELGLPVFRRIPRSGRQAVLLSWGGDGTFLDAVRLSQRSGIGVLGVNSGRMGFLANTSPDGLDDVLRQLGQGEFSLEPRPLIEISGDLGHDGQSMYAFNEFSLERRRGGLMEIQVEIDGKRTFTCFSDGLLLATPAGSTAWSLSSGGPIVAPDCSCLILTPISPHNLTLRPIVIPDTSTVTLTVHTREKWAWAGADNNTCKVKDGARIFLRRSEDCVFLVHLQNNSFWDALRDKMMWGMDSRETASR